MLEFSKQPFLSLLVSNKANGFNSNLKIKNKTTNL